jgi:hypothetical protein
LNPSVLADLEQRSAQPKDLDAGGHRDAGEGMCATEAVAWIAGEPHSDQPECLSPVLARLLRGLNDSLEPAERQQLKPLLAPCVGTASDDKDEQRRWLALNWLLHIVTPAWLELAGLSAAANELRGLPDIANDADRERALVITSAVRAEALAARATAEDRLRAELAHSSVDAGPGQVIVFEAAPVYAAAFAAAAIDAACRTSADAAIDAVAYGVADATRYGTTLPTYFSRRFSTVFGRAAELSLRQTRTDLHRSALNLVEQMIDPPPPIVV